ncbi:unnamed protein product, partial [Strongylus vulgaris]
MRSSQKSFSSSTQPLHTYPLSSSSRNGSISAKSGSRYERLSTPPATQYNQYKDRAPFLRDSGREAGATPIFGPSSDSRRASEDHKVYDSPVSSRVIRSEETNALLERYGVRRSSAGQSSIQNYLQQRRQIHSNSNEGPTVRPNSDNSDFGTTIGDGLHAMRFTEFQDPKQTSAEEHITQNEYISRLLAAHNRVDELLKSRGLSAEDESKYLRAWEKIPIVRKQGYQRVLTPSNSSDSGLSTDDESEPSSSESISENEVNCKEDFTRDEMSETCIKIIAVPSELLRSSLTCRGSTLKVVNASFVIGCKPSFRPMSSSRATKLLHFEESDVICIASSYAMQSTSYSLKHKQQSVAVAKVMPIRYKGEHIEASFEETKLVKFSDSFVDIKHSDISPEAKRHKDVRQQMKMRSGKPIPVAEQQRTVLSNLICRAKPSVPSTAEISIQHCSFYQISSNAVESFPEKHVRINLRLTERAPTKCSTVIALPTTTRPLFAYLTVSSKKKKTIRRAKTMQNPDAEEPIGKLNRSMSIERSKGIKQRKVNRIVIPNSFLHLTSLKSCAQQEHGQAEEVKKEEKESLEQV